VGAIGIAKAGVPAIRNVTAVAMSVEAVVAKRRIFSSFVLGLRLPQTLTSVGQKASARTWVRVAYLGRAVA
jgi:hypothetical protein